MCNDFACVTLFNLINEDNRRLILNEERTLFSFLKQVSKNSATRALTRVVQPEKVASRIGQISTQPHSLLAWQMGMC